MIRYIQNLIVILFTGLFLFSCSNNPDANTKSITAIQTCENNTTPVSQVRISEIIASDGNARIEWGCSGATAYKIYYSKNKDVSPGNGIAINIKKSETKLVSDNFWPHSFYDIKIQNNSFYYFVMTAIDSAGNETIASRTVTAYPSKILLTRKGIFPDTNLHSCILERAVNNNRSSYSKTKWKYLTDITDFSCDKIITDLTGIEKLTNLTSINYSSIPNINFNDSRYAYLSNVYSVLFDNIVSVSIDSNILSSMTGLDGLDFWQSGITNTRWLESINPNIRYLSFVDTVLSDTVVSQMNSINFPKLRLLSLENTGRNNLDWLNTANLGNLNRLYIQNEVNLFDLTSINASNLPRLNLISIVGVKVTNLDWLVNSNFANLYSLRMRNTGLTSLAGIQNIKFAKEYVGLDFSDNKLTSLNEIFSSNINLNSLSARNNLITRVSGISNFGDKLTNIDLSGNKLSSFSDFEGSAFPELISLSLSNNQFGTTTGFEIKSDSVTSKKFPKLEYLDLSSWITRQPSAIPISDFSGVARANLNSLLTLAIAGNSLSNFTSFNGANFSNLKELFCDNCQITSFDGFDKMGLKNISQLSLWSLDNLPKTNQTSIFSGLVNANLSTLKQLNLFSGNSIIDLSWFKSAQLTGLEQLVLEVNNFNNIDWMDPAKMSSLMNLYLISSTTQTPVNKNFTALGNVLTQLPVLKRLSLQAYYNTAVMDDLTWLNQNNGIPSLELLEINNASLKNISGLSDQILPNLHFLNLSNNSLVGTINLANSGLTKLEEINVVGNLFRGANSVQPLSIFNTVKKIRLLSNTDISNKTSTLSCADLDNLIMAVGPEVVDIDSSIPDTNCILSPK